MSVTSGAETSQPEFTREIPESAINVSAEAREKMAELMADADDDVKAIRIFVSGGGCGGMTYGMTYTDAPTEYDSILEGDGFTMVVDPVAMAYLEGCNIDFVSRGLSASFVFNNVFKSVGGSGACGGCGGGGCF